MLEDGASVTESNEADSHSETDRVSRRVVCTEKLGANKTTEVGRHDEHGHGDGSLLWSLLVEGEPSGVQRVPADRVAAGQRQSDVLGPSIGS